MNSTTPSTTVNSSDVFSRPTPSVSLIQSAKLSPTVVHRTLMIQNQMTTSGTLFRRVRVVGAVGGLERCGFEVAVTLSMVAAAGQPWFSRGSADGKTTLDRLPCQRSQARSLIHGQNVPIEMPSSAAPTVSVA